MTFRDNRHLIAGDVIKFHSDPLRIRAGTPMTMNDFDEPTCSSSRSNCLHVVD